MSKTLEDRLSELKTGLRAMEQAWERTRASPGQFPEAAPWDGPAVPAPVWLGREDLLDWLTAEVRRRSGIAAGLQLRGKIDRLVDALPAPELPGWVQRLASLDRDHPDWLAIFEALTIHETYFLRDFGQLDFMRRTALAEVIGRERRQPWPRLRLWSAGCSTGEEVYSLAMLVLEALLEAGEAVPGPDGRPLVDPRWSISVLGTDLSRRALLTAEAGTYPDFGLGPFRNMPERYWRHFTPETGVTAAGGCGKVYRIGPELRNVTRFQLFNLAGREPPENEIDIALCRNVMIYFDSEGKRRVLEMLHRALRPGGHVLLGPTDVPADPTLFKVVWGPATVIYRKREDG